MRDYHSILDVAPDATFQEIKGQYKQLVRIYHPDRFNDPEDKRYAEDKLREIVEAYRVLEAAEKAASIDAPPRPVVSQSLLDFGTLPHGARGKLSFQVGNLGGPPRRIDFLYSEQNSWFKVVKSRRTHADKPTPLEVQVQVKTRGLDVGRTYSGWLHVTMDDVPVRVNLAVSVAERNWKALFSARLGWAMLFTLCGAMGLLSML